MRIKRSLIALAGVVVVGAAAIVVTAASAPAAATASTASPPTTNSASTRMLPLSAADGAMTGMSTMPGMSAMPAVNDPEPDHRSAPLVQKIREATDDFHNIARAEAAGYVPFTDVKGISCIEEPGMGAMGVHYVNPTLIANPSIDPTAPEALVYAPDRDGTLRLAALEFIVDKVAWDKTHSSGPQLFSGRPFSVTKAPNRYGLNTFYSQHVWAWKSNRAGLLAMWNPGVHCAWA